METTALLKVLTFHLAKTEYALPVSAVQSIERPLQLTRVPNTAPFVKGVVNLKGMIMPVLDMRCLIGEEKIDSRPTDRILIVELDEIKAGLIVDSADHILDFDPETLQLPEKENARFLKGVVSIGGRRLHLLDLAAVFNQSQPEA